MKETTRQSKVAKQIQKDISEIILKNGNSWVPGKLVTVTVVKITPDLGLAKVYVSIFPSTQAQDAVNLLDNHHNFIRNELGKKLRHQLKKVPELNFYLDDSLDYIDNIDNLLKSND